MILNATEARGLFTKELASVFKERPTVMSFLRSFFTVVEKPTKFISIEVERGTEKVAVDVLRGTNANRNKFGRSSEKIYEPPYYYEDFDATELDFYDQLFASNAINVNTKTFDGWLSTVADKMGYLRDKIDRAYELQAKQVVEDGIVQLVNGDNIDFKRKAASKIDLGAGYWTGATTDPIADIKAWCQWLRTEGKAQGHAFNMILGSKAIDALLNNQKFKERADIRNYESLMSIKEALRNSVGGVLHGYIMAGEYKINLWTYPEYYDAPGTGTSTPYISEDKIILIPENAVLTHAFAAVPMLFRDRANAEMPEYISNVQGQYVLGNYVDAKTTSHVFDIKSAGLLIPTSVDRLFTAKVVA